MFIIKNTIQRLNVFRRISELENIARILLEDTQTIKMQEKYLIEKICQNKSDQSDNNSNNNSMG